MTFHQPVLVGDEVSFHAAIERVGRTSMVIRVEAWRRSRDADEVGRVTGPGSPSWRSAPTAGRG